MTLVYRATTGTYTVWDGHSKVVGHLQWHQTGDPDSNLRLERGAGWTDVPGYATFRDVLKDLRTLFKKGR